mgnify:CR=1 FL=1
MQRPSTSANSKNKSAAAANFAFRKIPKTESDHAEAQYLGEFQE